MTWYTIQTTPNYEAKVIEGIKDKLEKNNLSDKVRELFSPEENVITFKNGQKKIRKKKLYSNYIFVDMDYSDSLLHLFRTVKGFSGFLGSKSNPTTISESMIEDMKSKLSKAAPKPKSSFTEGDLIRVRNGSFVNFEGTIQSLDQERNKVKVSIHIFGRETITEIDLDSIELIK